jgi:hypothetical protein
MKYLIIDNRMRQIEKKELIKRGYKLIEIKTNNDVYEEISSHVDIFACKVGNKIIVEKSQYNNMPQNSNIEMGEEKVQEKYPYDIKYNVCIIGKKAIHNFEYTDKKLKEELIKQGYELINTSQGYTNCSIAVIDDNSAIVTDKGLYKILEKHKIDVLYLDYELDIKLLSNKGYSKKKGFIGGAISRIGKEIIVFGDLNKIDKDNKIRNFILDKKLDIVEFKGLDVIDYGGVIESN